MPSVMAQLTYKAVFTKQVMGCEDNDDDPNFVRLVHTLELPFAPVEGMWFSDGDWDELATIVVWDVKMDSFRVMTPKDDEIEQANMLRKDHRPLEAIVRDYVEQGWDVEDTEEVDDE